ncbi:MAG TPA: hypothetical protein VJ723_02160 [Candidatus Angelobacter sp.]|nr:hypothetical protein [Candidatus Angelobacter sp.]
MPKTDAIIGLIALALVSLLAVLLIRRRIYREFPFFFGYVLFSILIMILKFCLFGGDYLTFFKVYWGAEAFYAVGTLLVLNEAFRSVFFGFYELWWFRFLFPGVVVMIAAIAVTEALRHPPTQAPQIIGVILSVESAVNYIVVGLFGLFFLLVLLFGLRWRSYPFGIVLGFAASAFGSWFAYGLRSESGTKFNFLFKLVVPMAYLCGAALWLVTFIRPPDTEPAWLAIKTPEEMLKVVQRYVKLLKGLRKKNDNRNDP